jgi:hypothetical protein
MNINGLPPIGIPERTGEQSLTLRTNQRIGAEVLRVSGDQVELNVQGIRVVARLLPGEQSVSLQERRFAQFVVKGMVDGVVQLQVVPDTSAGITSSQLVQWSTLAKNLLTLLELPLTEENMNIGRALLNQGLPVTEDLVLEMQDVLKGLQSWGQTEANLAAALKAGGYPLSSGVLELMMKNLPEMGQGAKQLGQQLTALMQSRNTPPEIRSLAQEAVTLLQQVVMKWDGSPENLKQQLSGFVNLFGKSVESHLYQALMEGGQLAETSNGNEGLLLLSNLQYTLNKNGYKELAGEVERFLDSARQMQFLNTAQLKDPSNPPWLVLNLALGVMNNSQQGDMVPSNLRVAYRSGSKDKEIKTQDTRLVLTLELGEGEYMETDLSMLGNRVGAWMRVPDESWRELVETELPSLESALEELGFQLSFSRCEVNQERVTVEETRAFKLGEINLEV